MPFTLADLDPDVADFIAPEADGDESGTPELLAQIGIAIGAKRDAAVAARLASGIEDIWRECEEAYVGIDDANRAEFKDAKWSKPVSMDGPVTTDAKNRRQRNPDYKSTVFVRLTARYVDAGAAKLGEILLPPDDKAFSFSEMPVPELLRAKLDKSQVVHDGMGNVPLTRPAQPGEAVPPQPQLAPGPAAPPAAALPAPATAPAAGGAVAAGAGGQPQPAQPPRVPLTVADLAEEAIEQARDKAKRAEEQVYNWMVESQYTSQMRKVIFDSARCGPGVLKGPIPNCKRAMAFNNRKLVIQDNIVPGVTWVDFWNIYPDPACGENIHDGDHILELDYLSERQLRKLKDQPGYIASQIDQVLEEGPDKSAQNGGESNRPEDLRQRKGRYKVWYWYGSIKREEIECIYNTTYAGEDLKTARSDLADGQDLVYAIVTLVNDSVIKATLNPLDSGEFPYHIMPWQRRAGHWAGIGVGEQIRTPQRMLNATTRAMLNNAGKASGSQIILNRKMVTPANGDWTITPDKLWFAVTDMVNPDVRAAFMAVDIPIQTDPLMKMINYALQLAEESTSIPLVTQGQSGETTPDTLGATQLQNNNANQLLRSIGYTVDDNITEPLVRQFYEWYLMDPDIDPDDKGEFEINAHGSAALVERAIAIQNITQMGAMALNPAYGIDPKRWMKQKIKADRLNPEDFQYTPEEQARMDSAPPPQAPAVQAASIAADAQIKLGVMKQTTEQQSLQSEQQIEQAAQTLEGQKVQVKATVDLHDTHMRYNMALLEHANRRGMTIDQVKGELAKTAMQLQTEQQLNTQNNAASDIKHQREQQTKRLQPKPPVQVPGRAAPGHAFEQSSRQQ